MTRIITRILTTVGLAGLASLGACCYDLDYQFCEGCSDKGKTAYACEYTYRTHHFNPDGSTYYLDHVNRLSGCYDTIVEMTDACQETCDGYDDCQGIDPYVFKCDGVDDCAEDGGDGGDATAGDASAAPDCSSWSPSSSIQLDPTGSGARTITRDFWFGLISEPNLVSCDTTTIFANPSGPGFVVDNVDPGSLADSLGLMNGDVLFELNQQPLDTMVNTRSAVIDLLDVLNIELVVHRGTTTKVLEYSVQ